MLKRISSVFISSACVLTLISCGGFNTSTSSVVNDIASRDWTPSDLSPDERDYCSEVINYTSQTVTIQGVANFLYREIDLTPGQEGLGDVSSTPRPIKHAQYEVLNGADEIVQCGETDESGEFSFQVPRLNRAHTLRVYSRSNNNFNKASVFIAPETNELYSLDYNFVATENSSNIEITAEAKNTVLGGAFFILDNIHTTYDRLQPLIVNSFGSVRLNDIPKADIYWAAGFNPSIYVGASSGLSYFSRTANKIFILGGENGDINFADTDHFDPSIITHEYFHFLESNISGTDSPGGAHNGNQLIDPRLAWSEGAAQFFQGVINEQSSVIDTRGNIDGNTGILLSFGLESGTNDLTTFSGEGDFREFAVARFLWDIYDTETSQSAPENAFDTISDNFENFWQAFANTTSTGFNTAGASFRTHGLLLTSMFANGDIPANETTFNSTWRNLLNNEGMTYPQIDQNQSFRGMYGMQIEFSLIGQTDEYTLEGPFFPPATTISQSNVFRNVNFHTLTLNQTRDISLTVGTNDSATGGSLEFFIFDSNYVNFSQFIQQGTSTSTITLPPGDYLVAVMVRTDYTVLADDPAPAFIYSFPGYRKGILF